MKITEIQPQKKRADQGSIFVDNKYSFSLPLIEISKIGLRVGQEIDGALLKKLKESSQSSKALASSLRLLSYRPRSEWEIDSYLNRKGYSTPQVQKTISWLRANKYIDDEKFAKTWANNRLEINNASLVQIKSELRAKRVDRQTINEVIDDLNVDEVSLIKKIIDKKRSSSRYKDDLKLKQYLSRKGFSYDKIKDAFS